MYQLNDEYLKQNGWSCFDIAVGFERKDLIKFALNKIHLLEFRELLAPEIKHAAALAAIYINSQDEKNKKLTEKISKLFNLPQELNNETSKEQLEGKACDSTNNTVLFQFALPVSMHNQDLQIIVNNYTQAHEDMRDAVAICNQALGYQKGKYVPMEALDRYFENPINQKYASYSAYQQARMNLFVSFEKAFNEYCLKEDICKQYIQEYYAKNKWFSFQLSLNGEVNTSMVDIVARMLDKNIIIHKRDDLKKILYSTKMTTLEEVHVAFNGINHFVGMKPNNKIISANHYRNSDLRVKKPSETLTHLPPILKPEDYSENKRTDLLPGFAGSLYQGDAAIAYMLDGIEKKLHFDIRTEVGDTDKWDDIKIIYADRENRATTKITYIQSKHGYAKDSFLLPGNFYNKTGKAQLTINGKLIKSDTEVFTLYMYLDDWLKLKYKTDTQDFNKAEFVLFSNRSICDEVIGFKDCFEKNSPKLTQDFIQGIGIYATKPRKDLAKINQFNFRKELFESLLKNSEQLKLIKSDPHRQEELIKLFLGNVEFRLGEKHLDDIENDNKKRIATLYPDVNAEAIYYAFRFKVQKWLRDKDKVTSFTNETINECLKDASNQYLILGQYIGTTNRELRKILIKPDILLERDSLAQSLIDIFNFKNLKQYQLSIISGSDRSGKSFAVTQCLEQKIKNKELIPGEFLYLTTSDLEIFKLDLFKISALKFVVIDLNNSQSSEHLNTLCNKAEENNIEVFLIIRQEYVEQIKNNNKLVIKNHLTIDYLTDEEIKENITQLDLSTSEIRIARKKFNFTTDYSILGPVLKFPSHFCEMAESSICVSAERSFPSEKDEDVYIKQEINVQQPIYSLLSLLKNNTHIKIQLFINNIDINPSIIVDILSKSDLTFISTSLYEITEQYESNQFDLKKFTQSKLVSDQQKENRQINWIITTNRTEWENLPDNLRNELNNQGRIIYITSEKLDSQNILRCQFQQITQSDILTLVPPDQNQLELPKPFDYIDSKQPMPVTSIIDKIEKKLQRIVVVAPAGAGKSTFTKKMQEAWVKNESGRQIAWICRIRLSKLRKKDNKKTLEKLVTERIKEKLLNWQTEYIKNTIRNHQLVLILDGWDEVKEQQQEDCQEVLARLFKYPNVIVTTRPNDFSSIALLDFNYIKLLSFDTPQIKQYVQSFFGDNKFSELACNYLEHPQTKELYNLIGIPMQCFLLCKALKLRQQWLDNHKIDLPWSNQPLSKSRLYELFISANLQEYLIKHEGMHTVSPRKAFNRCKIELKRLQENALTQYFNIDNQFSYEKDLDDAIIYFGFIEPITLPTDSIIYSFKHQTYIEYFAAINLATKLIGQNAEKCEFATNIIKDKRYIPRYRLVWQFMASIISYGDLQLSKMPTTGDIEKFWSALCMEPLDVIGIAHNALIKDCLENSNWQAIEKTKYREYLAELYHEINLNPSLSAITQNSIDHLLTAYPKLAKEQVLTKISDNEQTLNEALIDLSNFLDANKKEIFKFNKWALQTIKDKISKLAKIAQNNQEKLSLIDYLLNSINGKYPNESFVIITAIIDVIQEIGVFNEQVEVFLRKALTQSLNKLKIRAAQVLIKFGCKADNQLFNALWNVSHDTYNGIYTFIAYEALTEIGKITATSTELVQTMLSALSGLQNENKIAAIFESLGKAIEIKEQIFKTIFNISFEKKYHAYTYVALSHLGFNYAGLAITKIVKNNLCNLNTEIPFLLEQAKEEDLALKAKAVNFLISQTPNYQTLMAIKKLLDQKNIDISGVKEYLIKAFINKDITVISLKIIIDYDAVDNSVIDSLLNIPHSGFWLVDGGLPAISYLANHFDEKISSFLIKIIHEGLYNSSSVFNAMNTCCKNIAENLPNNVGNLKSYVKVLGELFLYSKPFGIISFQLNNLLDILKAVDSHCNLIAFTTVLLEYYFDKCQIQHLWLLMLFAKAKSFAVTFDKPKITIIGSNFLVTKEVNEANALIVQHHLNDIVEKLIEEKLISIKLLDINPYKAPIEMTLAEMIVNRSPVFIKNSGQGNIMETEIYDQPRLHV